MELPNHPLNRFLYVSAEGLAGLVLRNQIEAPRLQEIIDRLIHRTDEDAFRRTLARLPALPPHCQPIVDEACSRMKACRVLLQTPTDPTALKSLHKETCVLRLATAMLSLATRRAMGPTPNADVNCILRCVSRGRFGLAKKWAQGQLHALQGYGDARWLVRKRGAYRKVIQALILRGQGDKACQPFDLDGALAQLAQTAQQSPRHHGPPQQPSPRQPISALWTRDPLNVCYSHVFPDWPWWWLWPQRTLPEVPWNQGGPTLISGVNCGPVPEGETKR